MRKLLVCALVMMSGASYADGPKDKHGINISFHDGGVDVDGLDEFVDAQLDAAVEALRGANLPPEARDKLTRRLGELRAKLKKHLGHLDIKDMDELGREMDELGREMNKWGEDFGKEFGKDFAKQFAHAHMPHVPQVNVGDDDDDMDMGMSDDGDSSDADDDDDDARGLGDLSLNPSQRDAIGRLRADTERQLAAAKRQLAAASKQLHDVMRDPDVSDADLSRAVDAVAQQEATIRKVRILAWHGARRILDDSQRHKVERAARVKSR